MLVAFYASRGKKFDEAIAAAFAQGCSHHAASCVKLPTDAWDGVPMAAADVGVVVGVKDKSGPIFAAYRAAGKHAVFIDKGYTRIRGGPLGTLYWRVSVDDFQPTAYFQAKPRSSHRWDRLAVDIVPVRAEGDTVLFAGSSQKFCDWHQLGDANEYAAAVLRKARRYTRRELVYRPKPSWKNAKPVEGFGYSPEGEKFSVDLAHAHCLVTYGSNACFEALINGVPTVVLGNGVTKPLSDTTLKKVDDPYFPPAAKVHQLAYDLAHCQWTLAEMAAGLAWEELRAVIKRSK